VQIAEEISYLKNEISVNLKKEDNQDDQRVKILKE